ncbi:hypothetical protein PN488_12965 [Nodularia spumigena CS-591/12]|uniref:hypothetical protein n=1 Tax=Cyanophyceae TaxID=3028117 RepID=UPI00232E9A22|nr:MULTISPECIES: hypothetical protein [Cyanophyceae]MDB9305283.1 hypothetical protein [Nodularia spumigena CS-591/12]MDB9398935.1 hypothetical protein [Microcystis aeruginosa CS-567/02-A1]
MVHSFILPQETISIFQERLGILERCLNDANPQDEVTAEILELANSRQISLIQLREEFRQAQYKVNKITKLGQKLNHTKEGELAVFPCVKIYFLLKEIADKYWDFLLIIEAKEALKKMTLESINLYQEVIITPGYEPYQQEDLYIILESLKHVIQSLIKACVKIYALSEAEINELDLGDFTPQESETMLISLASTKKWDQVYKNLA